MVKRVIVNHIQPEYKDSYIAASKKLVKELKAHEGMADGEVYACSGRDDIVIEIEDWPDTEKASKAHMTDTFARILPELKGFVTNETYVLTSVD